MTDISLDKISDAVRLIATKPLLVAILTLPSINHLLIHTKSSFLIKTNFIFVVIGIFTVPIIYGIYLESIKQKDLSLLDITRKYFLNYILTILLIYSPLVLMTYAKSAMGVERNLIDMLLRTGVNVVTIYVVPFVFLTGYVLKSILAGSIYTLTNIKDNLDLVVLSVIAAFATYLTQGQIYVLFDGITLLASSLSFIFGFLAIYLSCVVFVMACIRLKEITIEV